MHDVRKKFLIQLFVFAFLLFAFLYLSAGCATSGALVPDIGGGASEYRAVQGEIRSGETELAVTGAGIEHESRELRSEIGEIGAGISELERSIGASAGTEQEIGIIIQRVRERELDPALVEGWRNSGVETD